MKNLTCLKNLWGIAAGRMVFFEVKTGEIDQRIQGSVDDIASKTRSGEMVTLDQAEVTRRLDAGANEAKRANEAEIAKIKDEAEKTKARQALEAALTAAKAKAKQNLEGALKEGVEARKRNAEKVAGGLTMKCLARRVQNADEKYNSELHKIAFPKGFIDGSTHATSVPDKEHDRKEFWNANETKIAIIEILKKVYIEQGDDAAKAKADEIAKKVQDKTFGIGYGEMAEVFPGLKMAAEQGIVKNPEDSVTTGMIWGLVQTAGETFKDDKALLDKYIAYVKTESDRVIGIKDEGERRKEAGKIMTATAWAAQNAPEFIIAKTEGEKARQNPEAAKSELIGNAVEGVKDPKVKASLDALLRGVLAAETDPAKWEGLIKSAVEKMGKNLDNVVDMTDEELMNGAVKGREIYGPKKLGEAMDDSSRKYIAGLILGAELAHGGKTIKDKDGKPVDFVAFYKTYIDTTLRDNKDDGVKETVLDLSQQRDKAEAAIRLKYATKWFGGMEAELEALKAGYDGKIFAAVQGAFKGSGPQEVLDKVNKPADQKPTEQKPEGPAQPKERQLSAAEMATLKKDMGGREPTPAEIEKRAKLYADTEAKQAAAAAKKGDAAAGGAAGGAASGGAKAPSEGGSGTGAGAAKAGAAGSAAGGGAPEGAGSSGAAGGAASTKPKESGDKDKKPDDAEKKKIEALKLTYKNAIGSALTQVIQEFKVGTMTYEQAILDFRDKIGVALGRIPRPNGLDANIPVDAAIFGVKVIMTGKTCLVTGDDVFINKLIREKESSEEQKNKEALAKVNAVISKFKRTLAANFDKYISTWAGDKPNFNAIGPEFAPNMTAELNTAVGVLEASQKEYLKKQNFSTAVNGTFNRYGDTFECSTQFTITFNGTNFAVRTGAIEGKKKS